MKKENQLPPFAPVDLRAWIQGNNGERDIIGAIRLIQWLEGPQEPIYLAQIVAACYPTSERQVKRDLAGVKAKGWLLTKRDAKGRLGRSAPVYFLAIEPMAFKDARLIINQRANLAPRSEEATGQIQLTYGPKSTDQEANMAPANIKEKDLSERPKGKTLPQAGGNGKHPEQDSFWAKAEAIWEKKNPGKKLNWPRMNGFPKDLYAALESFGAEELARCFSNMVNDPFSQPDIFYFMKQPQKWVNARKAQGQARSFNSPQVEAPASSRVIGG